MVNPNRFYTYAYLREDRTPYYIGKGEGRRLYNKGKGEVGKPKNTDRIIFLKNNLTEEEAFKHEIYMIAVFGRKDLGTGILHNKTDGGDGVSGRIASGEKNNFYGKKHTLETKQKIAEKSKTRIITLETREKLSKVNKGKIVSKETIEKFKNNFKKSYILISPSGKVIEEYDTIREICRKYNLDQSAFIKVLNKKQKHHKGWTFFNKNAIMLK